MSDALNEDSPSKKGAIDVRAMIQQYQTSPTLEEPDQLVKSRSMHDIRSMTMGDDSDSWVKLSVIDPGLPKPNSPHTPPKPPARRHKFLPPKEPMKPPSPVIGKLTPPPQSKPRLGSTDLNLLPKTQRSHTTKATKPIPPRPPPPTLKPTYRSHEKTPSPGPQTKKISNTPSHPSPPRQCAPLIIKQPSVDSEASGDRKSSHTSSSFSDSVEEEKKGYKFNIIYLSLTALCMYMYVSVCMSIDEYFPEVYLEMHYSSSAPHDILATYMCILQPSFRLS